MNTNQLRVISSFTHIIIWIKYSYRMYRLMIIAAITMALCGKAQSCKKFINVNIPYNVTLKSVVAELTSSTSENSVNNFRTKSSEMVNQLPDQNSPDYTAFEFVSSNVNDTSISLFLCFHRTYKLWQTIILRWWWIILLPSVKDTLMSWLISTICKISYLVELNLMIWSSQTLHWLSSSYN